VYAQNSQLAHPDKLGMDLSARLFNALQVLSGMEAFAQHQQQLFAQLELTMMEINA
jgi:hypothetical protein